MLDSPTAPLEQDYLTYKIKQLAQLEQVELSI